MIIECGHACEGKTGQVTGIAHIKKRIIYCFFIFITDAEATYQKN